MSDNTTLLDKNQKNQYGWGGPRPNSGRPKGSTKRPQIKDFITEEQAHAVVASLMADALEGKTDAAKYIADQYFGKALQSQELSGKDGASMIFAIAETIANKNDITLPEAERDSEES
jgi:flagellar motor protein MotB